NSLTDGIKNSLRTPKNIPTNIQNVIVNFFIFYSTFLFYQKIASLAIFYAARSPERLTSLLPGWDDFRTLRWEKIYKYPEVMFGQMKELLTFK
ncbi:MAG: hypothetical protein ACTSYM_09600, partial [Candidatus Baldrarchaeia archaeon]